MMWTLYILRCGDGSLYTGITSDLVKRLKEHSLGKASRYTRSRLPVRLVYREARRGRSSALKREYRIKQWPRAKKEGLIRRPREVK